MFGKTWIMQSLVYLEISAKPAKNKKMYQFLKGIVIEKIKEPAGQEKIILDVNGIGYEIYTSLSAMDFFGKEGSVSTVYTTLIHKEDQMSLIGFPTLLEKELFSLLFSVSGVGPKTALSILNSLTVSEITYAILNEDVTNLSKAQGIGSKTASRLILELKEKIKNWKHLPIAYSHKEQNGKTTNGRNIEPESDARSVLQSLGYTSHDINQAFINAKSNGNHVDPESLIHFSLKWLSTVKK